MSKLALKQGKAEARSICPWDGILCIYYSSSPSWVKEKRSDVTESSQSRLALEARGPCLFGPFATPS